MGAANVVSVKLAAKRGKLPALTGQKIEFPSMNFESGKMCSYVLRSPGSDELVVFYAKKIFGWAFVRDLTAAALDLNNRFGCEWPAMKMAGYASKTSTPFNFNVDDLPFSDQE